VKTEQFILEAQDLQKEASNILFEYGSKGISNMQY